MKAQVSRREFLRAAATGVAAVTGWSLLAACSSPVPTATTPGGAVGPTAGGAAPTAGVAAPTAGAAAPTAGAAAAASKPASTTGQQALKTLVGTLEGPEIVTDPARLPTSYKEAPALADLVKAGKLPAVKDRIGEDPLVLKPVHEIGKYGGNWRRAFAGPSDYFNGLRSASGPDGLLYVDFTGGKIVPCIAKRWEVLDGGRVTRFYLRRGMKWSDGQPLNADDFVFWFEDIYSNKDLLPTPNALMSVNGKPGVLEKIDEFTVQFKFQDPYYTLPEVISGSTFLGGPANMGRIGGGTFAAAHYLKQFHPKYVPLADLEAKAKEAKFDNWVTQFFTKNTWGINPDLPTVSPWMTESPSNSSTWTLVRNPYSMWVDTDGNQLPYIDKVVISLAPNQEAINLKAISGDIDFQARNMDLSKLPVFLENQAKGDFKIFLDPADSGADCMIEVNHSYEDDPEIAKWLSTTDFRRALSLGIDREQLNQAFWLGLGTIGSAIPDPSNLYFPGPEYKTMWSTYDPQQANQLLDKIGLDTKDADGFRLRTDGKGRLRLEIEAWSGFFMPYGKIGDLIGQHWKKIGIDSGSTEYERGVGTSRQIGNKHQLFLISNDGSDHLFSFPTNVFPDATTNPLGPLYGKWFASSGTQGKEPPPRIKEIMTKWRQAMTVPESEQIALGKEIWKIIVDEQIGIGTVGLSPAANGVRVAKTKLGNVPTREFNGNRSPLPSAPMTFYWKG